MRSLTVHLVNSDSHDCLPFHPCCPICRQTRLTAAIRAGGLVSPRTRALLAAGVLAVSASSPVTAAFAGEPDQQQEGGAPVAQSGPLDPAGSPDFDPGGDATDLPDPAPPVPQTPAPADPGGDDTAAVDQAPVSNPDDPVVDSGDGTDSTPAEPPAGATPAVPPTTPPAPPVTPVTPTNDTDAPPPIATGAPAPAAAVAPSTRPPRAVRHSTHHPRAAQRPHRHSKHLTSTKSQTAPPAVTGTATPTPALARPVTTEAVQTGATPVVGHRAKPGDRMHTVLAGESLWAIATDLLGSDASTAQVSRAVHRLWQLNHDQIGTGDPDLLMVATKLELR